MSSNPFFNVMSDEDYLRTLQDVVVLLLGEYLQSAAMLESGAFGRWSKVEVYLLVILNWDPKHISGWREKVEVLVDLVKDDGFYLADDEQLLRVSRNFVQENWVK